MAATAEDTLIAEAGRRLSEAAPDARVILFGSRARGEAGLDSDLDLLVIEPEIESRNAEYVRLRNALGELGVPIDLILYRSAEAEKWGRVPGTFVRDALREGRVLAGGYSAPLRYEDRRMRPTAAISRRGAVIGIAARATAVIVTITPAPPKRRHHC